MEVFVKKIILISMLATMAVAHAQGFGAQGAGTTLNSATPSIPSATGNTFNQTSPGGAGTTLNPASPSASGKDFTSPTSTLDSTLPSGPGTTLGSGRQSFDTDRTNTTPTQFPENTNTINTPNNNPPRQSQEVPANPIQNNTGTGTGTSPGFFNPTQE
jgi:hypothetical protein